MNGAAFGLGLINNLDVSQASRGSPIEIHIIFLNKEYMCGRRSLCAISISRLKEKERVSKIRHFSFDQF